jgi:hypothetical protein
MRPDTAPTATPLLLKMKKENYEKIVAGFILLHPAFILAFWPGDNA